MVSEQPEAAQEHARLTELASYEVMDTDPEPAFDALVVAATLVADVSFGGIGLLDGDREWFKARVGLPRTELPRAEALSRLVLEAGRAVILPDTRADATLAGNPYVRSGRVLFYAGFPLRTPSGALLGALCVTEAAPRTLTPDQLQVLGTLADQAMAQLELRRQLIEARRSADEASRRQAVLDSVFANVDVGLLVCDDRGTVLADNLFLRNLLGVGPAALDAEAYRSIEIQYWDGTPVIGDERPVERTLQDGSYDEELLLPGRHGTRYVQTTGHVLVGPGGERRGAVIAAHDVTAARERETELSARIRDVEALAEGSRAILGGRDAGGVACDVVKRLCGAQSASLMLPTPAGDLVCASSTTPAMRGVIVPLSATSIVGAAFRDQKRVLVDPDHDPRTYDGAADVLRREHGAIGGALYMPLVHQDQSLGVLIMTTDVEITQLPTRAFGLLEIVAAELVTSLERDRLRAELSSQASTDPLTGLANRRSWDERVAHAVVAAGDAPVCMAILDLDHYTDFNDSHGHQSGDLLLREVAAAWMRDVRAGDLLARLGGEEFGLLLAGCGLDAATPLLESLRASVPHGQTVSIGVSERRPGESVSTWYGRTDRALYRAKESGRNKVVADREDEPVTA
ncbi:MAG: sensor domain-containing diguanylate cyclase [Mycobacteriales bacterium]